MNMKNLTITLMLVALTGCATTMQQEFFEEGIDSNGDYYTSRFENKAKAGPFATQDVELQSIDWQYDESQYIKAGQTGTQDNTGQIEALKVAGDSIGAIAGTVTAVIGTPPPIEDTAGRADWIGGLLGLVGGDNALFNALLQWFFK